MAAPELYAPRRQAPARGRPVRQQKPPRQEGRQEAAEPGRRRGLVYRALTSGVALAVVGGFGYYAWSAYSGGRTADAAASRMVAMIAAPGEPVKVPPENPGGITIPGSEYEFFAGMTGQRLAVRPDEEFVLPPPEAPIIEPTPEIFDRPPPLPPELTLASVSSAPEPEPEMFEPPTPVAPPGVVVPPVLATPMEPLPVVEPSALTAEAVPEDPAAAVSPPRSAIDALVASIASDPQYGVASSPPPPAPAETTAATAAATPAQQTIASSASGPTVQLASMLSRELAEEEWARLNRLLPDLLAGRQPIIRTSTSNNRTYYRVSVAATDRADADALCAAIKQRSFDCIVHN